MFSFRQTLFVYQTFCKCYNFLTLHTPQATVHSSLVAEAWLAWHSIQRSMMWFLQIAQLSTTISTISQTNKKLILVDAWLWETTTLISLRQKYVVSTNHHHSMICVCRGAILGILYLKMELKILLGNVVE